MTGLQERKPVSVYRFLPRGWDLQDPLPPVRNASVYHYTSLKGLFGLIETKVAWASHVPDLNDPSERLYGWDVIRQRFADVAPKGSPTALGELEKILGYVDEPGDWYPRAFVFSASAEPDSLTQYRLYGQCQVELIGGTWHAVPADARFDDGEGVAAWRRVLYGPKAAEKYVDRMLAAAVAIIDSVHPEDAADESLTAMLALEVLALHIKHPAYRDEHEVRLVFSSQQASYSTEPKVRIAGDRLIKYLEARDAQYRVEGFIKGVMLGPLAASDNTVEAIQLHHRNQFPGVRGLSEPGLSVAASEKPYRA